MSILLIVHILFGSWAVVGSVMQRFQPMIASAATFVSGFGLVISGASLGRSCLSFTLFVSVMFAVRRYNLQPACVKSKRR